MVSSLRLNLPSLGGVVEEVGVVSLSAAAEEDAESSPVGGECNLTKDSPYFSFYSTKGMRKLVKLHVQVM